MALSSVLEKNISSGLHTDSLAGMSSPLPPGPPFRFVPGLSSVKRCTIGIAAEPGARIVEPPSVAKALEIMDDAPPGMRDDPPAAVWYESRVAMDMREDVPRGSTDVPF